MSAATSDLAGAAAALQPALVELRRDLHRVPEVGLHLPETRARLLRALDGLGLELTTYDKFSGVTGVLRGAHPGATVLLRSDMDALPITERTGLDFAVDEPRMHACGHDLHTTMVVGASQLLAARRDEIAGSVIFMFEPGEEGYFGARHMIEAGVLDAAGARPEAAYALHVAPGQIERGVVATRPGPLLASADRLTVMVRGASGHGARPHLAVDPVPIAAEIVTAVSTAVTRQFDVFDPVVLSFGMLQAGSAHNVIAESAYLEATMRAFTAATRDRLERVVLQVCNGVAAAHGVEVDAAVERLYPPTVNDDAAALRMLAVAEREFGPEFAHTYAHPLPGAEDFSFVLADVPGALAFLGVCVPDRDPATAPYNHSSEALYDESMLSRGAQLLAALALEHVGAGTGQTG